MTEDKEGFLYPSVNESLCVDCGICDRVCPMKNSFLPIEPIIVFAACNKDEDIRRKSSSGGIFTLLADKIIAEGGVVFGAEFNNRWDVVIGHTEKKEGIARFRGSKYVQAEIGDTYKLCEQFLKDDRLVLYSGTPCQIAGLKRYLIKDYANLLTVDVICHGVPSPMVWRKYLDEVRRRAIKQTAVRRLLEKVPFLSFLNPMPLIKGIRFRDKSDGWKKYRFVLELAEASAESKKSSVLSSSYTINDVFYENTFMKAFLQNLILRPSCHNCAAKCGKSNSDLTIGDFWGVQHLYPQMDDDKGTGLVLVNSEKGRSLFDYSRINYLIIHIEDALKSNQYWKKSAKPHPRRNDFFKIIERKKDITQLIENILNPTNSFFYNWVIFVKIWIYNILVRVKNEVRPKIY